MTRVGFHLRQAGYCSHPEIITLRGGSWKPCRLPSLFGLLVHPGEGLILYDTGYHPLYNRLLPHRPESLYPLLVRAQLQENETAARQIVELGYSPTDVKLVIISHFHADHFAGLRDFPKARFLFFKEAYEAVKGRSSVLNLINGFLPELLPEDFESRIEWIDDRRPSPVPRRLRLSRPGHDLFGDGSLIAVGLPGHKKGQSGLIFTSEEDRECFLVADSAWSRTAIRELRPPSRLISTIMENRTAYLRTLRELHELSKRKPGLHLIPSHCRETYAEWKKAHDAPSAAEGD